MIRVRRAIEAALASVLLMISTAASGDVRLTMADGTVTVVAENATLRQILSEWARVGDTTIVNLEQIPGGPISIELTNVPEREALDVLLQSVSGYVAAPRATPAANRSRFDRIFVLPSAGAPPAHGTTPGSMITAQPPLTFAAPGASDQPSPSVAQIEGAAVAVIEGPPVFEGALPPPMPQSVAAPSAFSLGLSAGGQQAQPPSAATVESRPWTRPSGSAAPGVVTQRTPAGALSAPPAPPAAPNALPTRRSPGHPDAPSSPSPDPKRQ